MKKILSALCVMALCLCVVLPLAACNTAEEQKQVMTVELNPSLEFILDGKNKVVSVNANNEDGNLILSAQTQDKQFVGSTSEQAMELYVSICKETGFLVKGSVKDGENEIKISFSGDQAQKDFDEMKKTVSEILSKENIQATVNKGLENLDEYINEQLEKCAPYIDQARLQALSYMEKVEELAKSREETAQMHSQAVKDAYYAAKENAFNQARFDAVKANNKKLQNAAFEAVDFAYTTATKAIETTRQRVFTDEDSAYQLALVAFQENKTAFLNYRNYVSEHSVDADMTYYENITAAYEKAEKALAEAYTSGINGLDKFQANVNKAYESVIKYITDAGVDFDKAVDEAQEQINESLTKFETSFATNYQAAIDAATQGWNKMKENLQKGYQPTQPIENN